MLSIINELKNLLDWFFCFLRGNNPYDDKDLKQELEEVDLK